MLSRCGVRSLLFSASVQRSVAFMAAERWEFEEATAWFSGSRGADESCDDVCAAALCGEEREDECPEPPTCLSDALEALWADTACAIHTDARESAGAAALTTCVLCGPDDYSNKYCLPGIIDSSPGVAYFGASTSGSGAASLCAVQYTDDRTEPLCPCLLPALGGFLGWTIVIWLSVASTVYVTGGLAYGRHKNPPTAGAKSMSLSHPNGEPALNWHPHRWHWGELVELCYDGFGFSLAHWRKFRGDADASYDPIGGTGKGGRGGSGGGGGGGGEGEDGVDEESGLVGPSSKQRRQSEPTTGKKKKKKKKGSPAKPRPSRRSLPAQLDDDTKQWLTQDEGAEGGGGGGRAAAGDAGLE